MYDTTSPIEQKQQEARILSSKFKDIRLRKRAYVDFTGAVFAIKLMQDIGLRAATKRSIFKCSKLYSDFEIIDIYCNSHMLYVVTAYNCGFVKIPVKHKTYDVLPEAYIVVDLKTGMKEAEIKGVITPEFLENSENDGKYYKFDLNNLQKIDEIIPALKKYAGIKSSIGRHLDCMNLFVPYIDEKLNDEDKKKLIMHILSCETCKRKLIETVEFDTKAKTIENHRILSKEDLISKDNFLKSLQKGVDENTAQLQGAIDVIYQRDELSTLKEDAFKYRADIPSKTKKLILLTLSVMAILIFIVSFAFNLPHKKKDDISKNVQGIYFEDNNTTDYGDDISNFEVKVPSINKNKGYMTVSKVSWEVASNITNDEQKKFLQTAGKSVRLNLQNDLLLSSGAAVNNRVKFDMRFLRDGNLESVTVSESSGTKAVDEVIKQSIENTLRYMRPPKNSFVGKKNTLTLVIDF